MVLRNINETKADIVKEPGAKQATLKRMIDTPDGADRFVLSVFSMKENGATPPHYHEWEHEIVVLNGSMQLVLPEENKEVVLKEKDVVFIPRGEHHGFNTRSDQECEFIVVAPTERPPVKNVYLSEEEYSFSGSVK